MPPSLGFKSNSVTAFEYRLVANHLLPRLRRDIPPLVYHPSPFSLLKDADGLVLVESSC